MQVDATGSVVAMRFGARFAPADAARLQEALVAFAPLKQLTLDFSGVRQFEDAAVVPLSKLLELLRHVDVRMRGLTQHQQRMLKYFGVTCSPSPAAQA